MRMLSKAFLISILTKKVSCFHSSHTLSMRPRLIASSRGCFEGDAHCRSCVVPSSGVTRVSVSWLRSFSRAEDKVMGRRSPHHVGSAFFAS